MADQTSEQQDLWVFGYGSLMWNPGFAFRQAVAAELVGYHRAFCVYSVLYRGTPTRPGLVLGLDRGGLCHGMAFRVAAKDAVATVQYLRAREQVTGVYRETLVPITIRTASNASLQALTFVIERQHPGYAHKLSLSHQADLIRAATGKAGSNLDYALNTICHLQQMGCFEPKLARLVPLLGPVFWQRNSSDCDARTRSGSGKVLNQHLRASPRKAPRFRPDQRKRFVHRDQLARRFELKWQNAR